MGSNKNSNNPPAPPVVSPGVTPKTEVEKPPVAPPAAPEPAAEPARPYVVTRSICCGGDVLEAGQRFTEAELKRRYQGRDAHLKSARDRGIITKE